jgi:hypothetical protein
VTRQLAVVLMSAVVVLGIVIVVKPRAAAVTEHASMIDIASLTKTAKALPAEQWPGY